MSIILMSEVGGRLSILLMKMVVITNMVVRFTLKAASKKKGLKKVVAKVIAVNRSVGKYVVINSLVTFRFKTIIIAKVFVPSVCVCCTNFQSIILKIGISGDCSIRNISGIRLTDVLSRSPIVMLIEHVCVSNGYPFRLKMH